MAETAPTTRRRRADGELSRARILDAATEIASERGYEGTGIALVSKKCGLPASSIYWHFKDKDDLIAAVIERSFASWLAAWELPDGPEFTDLADRFAAMARQIAKALKDTPDFLRLGLMLSLERRPVEPRAREMFLRVRDDAYRRMSEIIRSFLPDLDETAVAELAIYAISGADGLFIANEIASDSIDLGSLFEMHARAVFDAAMRLSQQKGNG